MLTIIGQMKAAFLLLFPTTKFRLILGSLVLITSFISVSELALAKMFMQIILNEGSLSTTQIIIYVSAFFLFFGATRAGHYFHRIYRVNVFDRAFQASDREVGKRKQDHQWRLAFELSTLLSIFTQMTVIMIFCTILNWKFGLLNILVVVGIIQVIGRIFRKQLRSQRKFVKARRKREHVPSMIKFQTRIKSGETGILLSGLAMLILFAALIYLSYNAEISASNTVVLFFGLRMQTSSLSSISTGLMRFARARTHSE